MDSSGWNKAQRWRQECSRVTRLAQWQAHTCCTATAEEATSPGCWSTEYHLAMYEYLGGNHWITISTLKCPPAVVCVYDSLHYQLSPSVKKTVADLLQTKKEHIIIQYMNTQVQEGGSDCGLFAIATATTLSWGGSSWLGIWLIGGTHFSGKHISL